MSDRDIPARLPLRIREALEYLWNYEEHGKPQVPVVPEEKVPRHLRGPLVWCSKQKWVRLVGIGNKPYWELLAAGCQRLDDDRLWQETPQETETPPQPARRNRKQPHQLEVSVKRGCGTATLDGKPFKIESELAARWLKVLVEHPGDWLSGSDCVKHDDQLMDVRTHRLRQQLPAKIAELIDSKGGKGSRIRLA